MSCVINKYFNLFKKNNINENNNNDNNNINNENNNNENNNNENNNINNINNNENYNNEYNNNENNIKCPCNNKATGIVYIKKYYNHNFLVCSVCLKHILLHVLVDNYIEL